MTRKQEVWHERIWLALVVVATMLGVVGLGLCMRLDTL
jgi:hypothetical protein